MGLATVYTRAGRGMDAPRIAVEVHISNGLPGFSLVGMAETSVKEARDRVRSALINSGFEFPAKRITVNLAPASVPKQGGRYDLPIAIGILCAVGQVEERALLDGELLGELGLNGEIKPVSGLLPAFLAAAQDNLWVICPQANETEAALISSLTHYCASNLLEVYNHLCERERICASATQLPGAVEQPAKWDDIIGQEQAKRALILAAAGNHHLLMLGPPGAGKSMLASRLPALLPPLSLTQALEVAAVYSLKGQPVAPDQFFIPPFRSPHHTSSAISLTGGGPQLTPGEISLAHHGVLFLDELPEYGRKTLDVLREPLQNRDVHIARASGEARYPAHFQLIAALNPSPTGDRHDGRTSNEHILRYLNRLSGPLLDRIDLQIEVPLQRDYSLSRQPKNNNRDSAEAAKHTAARARERQMARQGTLNQTLEANTLAEICAMSEPDFAFFQHAATSLGLSMRAFHRTLKVARTIADIDDNDCVTRTHVAEALGYRALDRLIDQLISS